MPKTATSCIHILSFLGKIQVLSPKLHFDVDLTVQVSLSGGWGNSIHSVGMNPIVLVTLLDTQQGKSILPPSYCKIAPGNQLACKFIDFLAARWVSVCDYLLLLLQINHVNNSNWADSGQSSFLLHRETVTAITRKTQAALMTAWELKAGQPFLFIIITGKTQVVRHSVCMTMTNESEACMAVGTHTPVYTHPDVHTQIPGVGKHAQYTHTHAAAETLHTISFVSSTCGTSACFSPASLFQKTLKFRNHLCALSEKSTSGFGLQLESTTTTKKTCSDIKCCSFAWLALLYRWHWTVSPCNSS